MTDDVIRTFESGPSDPVRFSDGPGTYVEVDVDAPASRMWDLVTDIEMPVRFSAELRGAEWSADESGNAGPGPGAVFTGHNVYPAIGEWSTQNHVTVFELGTAFGWATIDPESSSARWRWDIDDRGDTVRVRFSTRLGPGPSGTKMAIDAMPDKEAKIIHRRIGEVNANMRRTVEGVKALAEGRAPVDIDEL